MSETLDLHIAAGDDVLFLTPEEEEHNQTNSSTLYKK